MRSKHMNAARPPVVSGADGALGLPNQVLAPLPVPSREYDHKLANDTDTSRGGGPWPANRLP